MQERMAAANTKSLSERQNTTLWGKSLSFYLKSVIIIVTVPTRLSREATNSGIQSILYFSLFFYYLMRANLEKTVSNSMLNAKGDPFNCNFHIPQKYSQQRNKVASNNRQSLQIPSASQIFDKLSIEKSRLFNKSANNSQSHIRKVNLSDNRTNSISSSNSKSRLSANLSALQVIGYPSTDDDKKMNTQSSVKLKQIIGDSGFQNKLLQMYQSESSQSPATRCKPVVKTEKSTEQTEIQKKLSQMQAQYSIGQDNSIRECLQILRQHQQTLDSLKKQPQPVVFRKQAKEMLDKREGGQFTEIKSLVVESINRLVSHLSHKNLQQILQQMTSNFLSQLEIFENSALHAISDALILKGQSQREAESELTKLKKQLQQTNEQLKVSENERDALVKALNDMKSMKNSVDGNDAHQLKELNAQLQGRVEEMSEKESKLIKLVLAIKKTGVDIEKIYNEEVLNDDSDVSEYFNANLDPSFRRMTSFDEADESIVNDSDESSFNYRGKSEVQSYRQQPPTQKGPTKMRLNLGATRKQPRASNNTTDPSDSSNLSSVNLMPNIEPPKYHQMPEKVSRLQIDFKNGEPMGFHQAFMSKLHEFSESWRQQALKEDRRINK